MNNQYIRRISYFPHTGGIKGGFSYFPPLRGLRGTIYFLLLFILFSGCNSEPLDMELDHNETTTLCVNLDIPGLNAEQNSGYNPGLTPRNSPVLKSDYNLSFRSTLRAMSETNENKINYDNIHILVFEEVGQDEVFRYNATITALAPPQITLEVPVSKAQEKYRLVVIANATMPLPYIADGTPKNEVLDRFVFDCVGKWNTSDASFSPIPMWGEIKHPVTIKNQLSVNIFMHRALARVDIGLRFKFNNPNPVTGKEYPDEENDKESVWGLDNFKIKDVRIYRTLNKAYLASSAEKIVGDEVVMTNIPVSAIYNSDSGIGIDDLDIADNHPLLYVLPVGSDSYIREIYIPESLPSEVNASANNMPFLVIGGYFGEHNNTHVTYYRADFANYKNGVISSYRPVLRNHRYVFDIRDVGNAGYEDPGQALHAIESNLTLDMKEWNEQPFNYTVHGNYYCSIDTREVTLEARSTEGTMEVSQSIAYRTNLDLNPASNPFTYKWKTTGNTSNTNFDVLFDYSAKRITIKAKKYNVDFGAEILSDQLEITVKNYQFTIDVEQKAINADYIPDCIRAVVHGNYRENFALNPTNYISIKIVSNNTLIGLNYEVYTVEKNGIYFAAKGTFDTNGTYNGVYEYDLNLKGYGKLVNESGFRYAFNVTIIFNSITQATCSVGVPVGL